MRGASGTGISLLCLAMAASAAVAAAGTSYHAELSMTPFTLANRADLLGKGDVTAVLAGRTLTVNGSYAELVSDATGAQINQGEAMGVPGVKFGDLAVTGGRSGQLTGKVTLNPRQLAALKAGGLQIVISSVKAPDGTLWGWLIPQGMNGSDMR